VRITVRMQYSFHVKWPHACSTSRVHLRKKYYRLFSCHKLLNLPFAVTLTMM